MLTGGVIGYLFNLTGGAFGYMGDYVFLWALLLSLLVHTWCYFKFVPWRKLGKLGLVLGNVLVFACMVGVAAMAAESHLRFVAVSTDGYGVSLPARRWFALHTKLNSLGCRDKEWSKTKAAGTRRIAFVGDSFTYGWGLERVEDRFPDLVGAALRKDAGGAIEVMNVAKPGWGTTDHLDAVRHLITTYDIDEVVLCYVANDIEKLIPTTDDYNPIKPPNPTLFNPDSSCLLDYLYRRVYLPRAWKTQRYHDWLAEGFADDAIWRQHQQQLFAIITLCRENDVAMRAVLLPFIKTSGEGYVADRLHAVLERFFLTHQVPVLDLLPTIADRNPNELVVNARDPHPNEIANRRFAEALLAFMQTRNSARPSAGKNPPTDADQSD